MTPYLTDSSALSSKHPTTVYIGCSTCFDIIELYMLVRKVRQLECVHYIPPVSPRPINAHQPTHGSYLILFGATSIITETWDRFPYGARIVDETLFGVSNPSKIVPEYLN